MNPGRQPRLPDAAWLVRILFGVSAAAVLALVLLLTYKGP